MMKSDSKFHKEIVNVQGFADLCSRNMVSTLHLAFYYILPGAVI